MTGKEIRFKSNGVEAVFREGEKLKYEGKGDKKNLKKLKPIFDAILKADDTKGKKKNKLDAQKEIELMNKLQTLLMADGVVKADEAALGDEFKKSKKNVETFINEKLNAIKQTETPNVEKKSVEEKPVEEKPVEEKPVNQQPSSTVEEVQPKAVPQQEHDKRVSARAFNQAIQNQRTKFTNRKDELTAQFTQDRPIRKGDTLYKIAKESLGKENPSAKEINERIAEIALVNNIDNVNNVRIPSIKVPAGTPGANPAGGGVVTVSKSDIPVQKESLEDRGYKAGTPVTEEGFTYTEWTNASDNTKVYTTEAKDGTVLEAADKAALKQLKADYDAAETKVAPDNETEEAKTERQAKNLENMRKRIELSGGNIDVIKDVIDELKSDGNVDLEAAQPLVESLILTKDAEILDYMFMSEGEEDKVFDETLLFNMIENADALTSVYTEIKNKENAGIKLSDKEIELKEFYLANITGVELTKSTIDSVTTKINDISGKMFSSFTDEDGLTWNAETSIKLREFLNDLEEANNAKADSSIENDTDEAAKARAKQALFKKYSTTDDKTFAVSLAQNAKLLGASKEDVLNLVNKNGMEVIAELNFTPAEADAEAFNKTIADRVVAIYEADKGDPTNMYYIEEAFAKINAATYNPAGDVVKAIDKVKESFFDISGEDENKTYIFKHSRRPTYEEMTAFLQYTDTKMDKAILDSVSSIDDLGKGQFTQALEQNLTTSDLKAKYAELFNAANLDTEKDLEGAKKKVLQFINAVGPNIDLIPFDKIREKFGDVDFVKEHLGALKNEYDVKRKLTSLDIEVVQEGGKFKTTFAIGPDFGWKDSEITLEGSTEEEVRQKAEKYIRVQNISYEQIHGSFSERERSNNLEELHALFDEGDPKLQEAIVYVAVLRSDVQDSELINKMIATKKPGIANHAYKHANEEQVQKLIELVLDGGENGWAGADAPIGAELVTNLLDKATFEQLEQVYKTAGKTLKIKMLNKMNPDNYAACIKALSPLTAEQMKLVDNSKMGTAHVVKKGESMYNLVRDYMFNNFRSNPDMFPQLKKSAENNPSKWTDARIKEALNDYWKDFGDDLMKDLGVKDGKITEGQVIDFGAIKWSEHQPNWLNYNMLY